MPIEQQALLWGLAGFALAVVIFLAMSRSGWREELGDTGDLDSSRPVRKHPALGAGYRQGPVFHGDPPDDPYAELAKLAEAGAIVLTPRDLEHVNIWRRRDGKLPLTVEGFWVAIARQAEAAPLTSVEDWHTYLIAYAQQASHHSQHRVAVANTITILPGAPFNGQFGNGGTTT